MRSRQAVVGLREQAVALRLAGRTYGEIAQEVGVSKSTCSLWLRHLPRPPRRVRPPSAASRAAWDRRRAESAAARAAVVAAHVGTAGPLDDRDLELLAVTAYWCEGAKAKPWALRESVRFINSDPNLLRLFLAYLDLVGVPLEDRRYCVSIHESADLDGATAYWSQLVGVPPERFQRPALKRHHPTSRKNVGREYMGCLLVRVVRSRELYQRMTGVWQGIMEAVVAVPGRPAAGQWTLTP